MRNSQTDMKTLLAPFRHRLEANIMLQTVRLPLVYEDPVSPFSLPHYIKQMKLDTLFSSNDEIQLSRPFWQKNFKHNPHYSHVSWNGSSLPEESKVSGHQLLASIKEELGSCGKYANLNIYFNEFTPVLPLPYPRFLTEDKFNKSGQLVEDPKQSQFVEMMSSMTGTHLTGELCGLMKVHATMLRTMKISDKMQFKKDCYFEEDDFFELKEKMDNVYEAYEEIVPDTGEDGWDSDY